MELREQLQNLLGGSYQIERELGGGGMSRVFAATETAFGRRVVIKVLPAELGAGVNVERFKREIQVAANLQHPHIVPVLTAGEMGDVPFYTMPFIDGESLRARLSAGPMPIDECVSLLRDVARALAYAHEHQVVHRDIKPDNVLITGGSATVTDFGIAKAISAARAPDTLGGTSALTQMGTSIGTPAYMAPEQAAADPSTDHRADIYSFGCMAYEMLTGRPPFTGLSPHKLLAAHMGTRPQPVSELRPDTPAALAEIVMQCLEKDPDARPQKASDIARVLDAVSTGSTGSLATTSRPASFRRGAIMYAIAFAAAALLAKAAEVAFGVPDWALTTTIGIMTFGIPLYLVTAYVQRVSRRTAAPTPRKPAGTPAPTTLSTMALRASPVLSWQHVRGFMVSALGSFALLVVVLMVLRPLGLGPLKSLMASGQLHDRDRILVGDFTSTGSDTTLGSVVAEAVRADLGQSPVISVVSAQAVAADLQLMQQAPNTRVDTAVARIIARREGAKAIVTGDVHSLANGGFVVTMRLVGADSGESLSSLSGSANGAKDLIPTIGGLTRSLRRQMGESLKHVQASAGLAQVTTASIPALEKYTEAQKAATAGDASLAIDLFKQAITIDSGFASAYRGLAIQLSNRGRDREGQIAAIERAYRDTARLPEVERWLAVAAYWSQGPHPNSAKAADAYKSLLAIRPTQSAALNNLALLYANQRKFDSAAALLRRSLASNATATSYNNLIVNEAELGQWAQVDSTWAAELKFSNNNPRIAVNKGTQFYARGQFDSAMTFVDSVARANRGDEVLEATRSGIGWIVAVTRGQLTEGLRLDGLNADFNRTHGVPTAPLRSALDSAVVTAWFLGDKGKALKLIQAGLQRVPLDGIPLLDRPYATLAEAYSVAGRPDLARSMLSDFDKVSSALTEEAASRTRHSIQSWIAIAEQRYLDAAHEAQAADVGTCTICMLPQIGYAYDLAQKPDSAIAALTRYVNSTSILQRIGTDPFFLAGSYKRLGELWEAKGDRAKAAHYYGKFLDLWKNADAALQPQVADARKRLARLSDVEAR
ncbi:MAG TPA: protein kinase [Gemmatimonadaceae bacterium]|jgi:tetratricopeptide (TPR) repeat protein|nr:protein kinase [Gemmatimonadaceae bacterium]